MKKITITIEDKMQDMINNSCNQLAEYIADYIAETIEQGEEPSLEIWYNGSSCGCDQLHNITDSNIPIYYLDVAGLFYFHKYDLIEAYENAGVGDLSEENNPNKACIYFLLHEKLNEFFASIEDYETSIMEYAKTHTQKEIQEYIMEVCFTPQIYPRAQVYPITTKKKKPYKEVIRDKNQTFRITRAEKIKLQKEAKENKMKIGEYIRSKLWN